MDDLTERISDAVTIVRHLLHGGVPDEVETHLFYAAAELDAARSKAAHIARSEAER